jgi:hypothetical protein
MVPTANKPRSNRSKIPPCPGNPRPGLDIPSFGDDRVANDGSRTPAHESHGSRSLPRRVPIDRAEVTVFNLISITTAYWN